MPCPPNSQQLAETWYHREDAERDTGIGVLAMEKIHLHTWKGVNEKTAFYLFFLVVQTDKSEGFKL